MYKKLVIISHTEHFINNENKILGWSPTVEEINYLSKNWREVVHVACLNKTKIIPASSREYNNNNIIVKFIPQFGGKTLWKKFKIFFIIPRVLYQVEKAIIGASHVQLRVPMGIAIFLLPYFTFRPRKFIFWVKYANNWADTNPKISFKLQRNYLKYGILNCPVTINGFWDDQPVFCKSFENPCLYAEEVRNAEILVRNKEINEPYNLLFVGRVEFEKGLGLILDWLETQEKLTSYRNQINILNVIGEGKDLNHFKIRCLNNVFLSRIVVFLGPLSREEVHKYFKKSHFLLMPSYASEGFPKVFAESAAYGCIPVYSDVSSVGQYLNSEFNSIKWSFWKEYMNVCFNKINLNQLAVNANKLACLFTFENYLDNLKKKVFNDY